MLLRSTIKCLLNATCSYLRIHSSLSSLWLPSKVSSPHQSRMLLSSLPSRRPSSIWRLLLKCRPSLWKMPQAQWINNLKIRMNKWNSSSIWWLSSASHKIKSSWRLMKNTKTRISRLLCSTSVRRTPKLQSTCKTTCRRCRPLCPKAWACEHEIESRREDDTGKSIERLII